MACLPTPDRRARLVVAMPTQITLGGFRFGDAGLPGPAVERLETIARVISFVSHEVAGIFTRRRKTHGGEVLLGLFQCGAERRRVASLRRMDRAATTTPVSRSTACSGLKAKWLEPSFIRAIFASGSVGLVDPCSKASCPSTCDPVGPNRRSSASRRHSLWPSASASLDRSRHCRGAR